MTELPPLPEPAFRLRWNGGQARYTVSKPNIDSQDCYTAEQMIAIRAEAVRVALEQAADELAQADAETTERLSIIADEIIAGIGEPGRGLAEMIREGATALESHAAYVVRDVRAQALEEGAQEFDRRDARNPGVGFYEPQEPAEILRALKDKP